MALGEGEGGPERDFEKNWLLEINGVPCNIFTGADGEGCLIEGSAGDEGRTAAVRLLCPYALRNRLVAGLVGTVDYVEGTVARTPPFAFPLTGDDLDNGMLRRRLFCTRVPQIEGIKWFADPTGEATGLAGWGGFRLAVLTAEFTSPPYLIERPVSDGSEAFDDLLGQTYCISKTRTSGEVLSPPTGAYIYADGKFKGKPLDDTGAARIRCRTEISATRVRMPIMPDQTIDSLTGSVNEAPFTVEGTEYPPGSVLFTGANPEPKCDPYNGGIVLDIELTFLANSPDPDSGDPLDFNYFLDPEGKWVQVTTAAGDPIFPYADLNQLFADEIA